MFSAIAPKAAALTVVAEKLVCAVQQCVVIVAGYHTTEETYADIDEELDPTDFLTEIVEMEETDAEAITVEEASEIAEEAEN